MVIFQENQQWQLKLAVEKPSQATAKFEIIFSNNHHAAPFGYFS